MPLRPTLPTYQQHSRIERAMNKMLTDHPHRKIRFSPQFSSRRETPFRIGRIVTKIGLGLTSLECCWASQCAFVCVRRIQNVKM